MHVESINEYECQLRFSKFWCKRVDLLRLINVSSRTVDHACMRFGRFKAFNSINIVPCGQGKANFLKQEQRTWRAESENFGPLPLKYQWIRLATSLSQ